MALFSLLNEVYTKNVRYLWYIVGLRIHQNIGVVIFDFFGWLVTRKLGHYKIVLFYFHILIG